MAQENMTTEEMIRILETSRQRMHRVIDERYDSMIHCIRTGQPLLQEGNQCYSLSEPPFLFKGKKPLSIIFPNGDIWWMVKEIPTPCHGSKVCMNI